MKILRQVYQKIFSESSRARAISDYSSQTEAHGMQEIKAEHDAILDRFEGSARLGYVPADALIGQLHANLCAALEETRRQRGEVEAALAACLRRLDARFPAPLPPAPEKPIPPRRKVIRPLDQIWTRPPQPRPLNGAAQ